MDSVCVQPQLITLQTLHTTPHRSERFLQAAVVNSGQIFLPSFVLPTAHTERLPHLLLPALEGYRATANHLSKVLQVNLPQLSPAAIANFSIRNTALAATPGLQMLHRVQNGAQFLNYPCCSDLKLQTTLVNTSTGLLFCFILAEPLQAPLTPAALPRAGLGQRGSSLALPGGGRSSGDPAGRGGGSPPPPGLFPVPADGPLPTTRAAGEGTLTSPGLPDPGAQHAPGWARRCRQPQRPVPLPATAPRIAALRANATSALAQGRSFTWG